MNRNKLLHAAVVAIALAAFLGSCAKPPQAEIDAAKEAVAKAESDADLARVAQAMGPAGAVWPIIESAAGLDNAKAIAAAPQVLRVLFGDIDFQADLGMSCLPRPI